MTASILTGRDDRLPVVLLDGDEMGARMTKELFRNSDQEFGEVVEEGRPVIPQVEAWAKRERIDLPQGWKVDVAKRVKQTVLSRGIQDIDSELVNRWVRLFQDSDRFTTSQ